MVFIQSRKGREGVTETVRRTGVSGHLPSPGISFLVGRQVKTGEFIGEVSWADL